MGRRGSLCAFGVCCTSAYALIAVFSGGSLSLPELCTLFWGARTLELLQCLAIVHVAAW